MANVIPLPVREENDEVLKAVQELHACLDTHITETRGGFEEIKTDIRGVSERVARVEGSLGVDTKRQPFGLVSQAKAFWGIVAAVAAGAGGYKLVVAVVVTIHKTLVGM